MIIKKLLLVFSIFSITNLVAQEKPNILWVTMEDTSPQFIGCYGNQEATTPVIDKLAKEGVRFTNAFSTGTVCSASRSAIITGVHTFKMGTGNHRSNYTIPNYIKGFPYYLQQQGYYVSNNVKTDYNVANMRAFTKEAWNESSNTAGWWNRKPGQPFFSIFNFTESHQSRTMSQSYSWYLENVLEQIPEQERIAEDAFKMPPFYKDTPEMRKHFARVYNSIKLADIRIGELLDRLEKDNLKENTIIFFYADHGEGIPRGKTNGINLGYRAPFVIWFPEKYKHLSPWGTSGTVTSELIDFKDLAPTILELVGAKIPEYMVGRRLLGKNRSEPVDYLELSADRADNGPDLVRSITDGRFMYSRNFMSYIPQMRAIRYVEVGDITKEMRSDLKKGTLNKLQKSLFEERPAEYLYDIKNDIWETNNLASNLKYKDILKKMQKLLDKKIIETRDVHFLPEYEIGLISQTSTAYEFRLDNNKYPIKQIYSAASLSGKRTEKVTKKQICLLEDSNKFVRYWAILGLRSQSSELIKPYKKEVILAMKDTYLPVAVMASAIAYGEFGDYEAQEKLKAFCSSKNMEIALMAISQLLYFNNKQPFNETILGVYDMDGRDYKVRAACHVFMRMQNIGAKNFTYKR